MKKTILIALVVAANGLLAACVYPSSLAMIAPQPSAPAVQASR